MKKLGLVLISISMTTMAFADSSGQAKWNWPLVSVWQSYESGSQVPMDSSAGGVATWPSTKALDDPYLAAREGTRRVESKKPSAAPEKQASSGS